MRRYTLFFLTADPAVAREVAAHNAEPASILPNQAGDRFAVAIDPENKYAKYVAEGEIVEGLPPDWE